MSFLTEEKDTLSGDVSINVVRSEPSADSRNLHCQTSTRDSASVTASERKDTQRHFHKLNLREAESNRVGSLTLSLSLFLPLSLSLGGGGHLHCNVAL